MKVATRVRFGLRALVEMALRKSESTTSAEEMARLLGVPAPYMGRILRDLKRAGLVVSERGKFGGYGLARAPEDIRALEVWEALQDRFMPMECVVCAEACDRVGRCYTRGLWAELHEASVAVLQKTIAEMVESGPA